MAGLKRYDTVLSGYHWRAGAGRAYLDYCATGEKGDPLSHPVPVMGDPDKGCIVAPGVAEFNCKARLLTAAVITLNLLELYQLSGYCVSSVDEAVVIARELVQRKTRMVLVKHLSDASYNPQRFKMVQVTANQAWHTRQLLVDFGARKLVGMGALNSGLLLVSLLNGLSSQKALEHVTAVVYEVIKQTKESAEHELQVVAAPRPNRAAAASFPGVTGGI